jgi:putative nucleotidyltransferase with HDIG domain
MKAQIEQLDALPTIPTVIWKLLEMFENPQISLAEIAAFIGRDPVLAAKILKLVNSPIYGFPRRISSITQALLLLGLNVAKGLLLGISVLDVTRKSFDGLWEHSVGCGIVAGIIARRKGVKDPEAVSVAGLLHDIGKVFLSMRFPDEYRHVMAETNARGILIAAMEKESFGVIHDEIGGWVGKKWNFPSNLIEQIAYHHEPHFSKQFAIYTAIVHLADILIRGRGFGFGGDGLVPSVNDVAWDLLNLSDADIRETLIEMEDRLEQTVNLSQGGEAL